MNFKNYKIIVSRILNLKNYRIYNSQKGEKMTNYVFYDDTDCGGIVYHSNYITFCERARSYIFFENGIFPHEISSEESRGFVVRSVDSKFFYPLQFADKYEVKSKVFGA